MILLCPPEKSTNFHYPLDPKTRPSIRVHWVACGTCSVPGNFFQVGVCSRYNARSDWLIVTARSQVNNGRVASARSNSNGRIRVEAETILRVSVVDKPLRKAEEVNFKAKFSFVTSLSAAETQVFGLKFIGLYGTVVFIAIRDFSC